MRHLLLVSSYLPEIGQSLSSFGGEALAETFLQDCDPEIQRQAMDKTARQSLAVLEQPVKSAARLGVPLTSLEATALDFFSASGASPTRKSLDTAERQAHHSHHQQREPSGRLRNSIFRRADERRHVWAFDPTR